MYVLYIPIGVLPISLTVGGGGDIGSILLNITSVDTGVELVFRCWLSLVAIRLLVVVSVFVVAVDKLMVICKSSQLSLKYVIVEIL